MNLFIVKRETEQACVTKIKLMKMRFTKFLIFCGLVLFSDKGMVSINLPIRLLFIFHS